MSYYEITTEMFTVNPYSEVLDKCYVVNHTLNTGQVPSCPDYFCVQLMKELFGRVLHCLVCNQVCTS